MLANVASVSELYLRSRAGLKVRQYYVGSTRFILPKLFDALKPDTPPDRMKGALYVLSNKPIGT